MQKKLLSFSGKGDKKLPTNVQTFLFPSWSITPDPVISLAGDNSAKICE